jgi:hypothetical protein
MRTTTPLIALALLVIAAMAAPAAEQFTPAGATIAYAPASAPVTWVPGQWQWNGAQYVWREGYWQSAPTTVCATPAPAWVEGQWVQGANGWTWIDGHYEQAPPTCTTQPPTVVYQQPAPPTQVVYVDRPVYQPATTVVYERPVCRPTTTVVYQQPCYQNTVVYGRPVCRPTTTVVYQQPAYQRPAVSVSVGLPHHLPLPPLPHEIIGSILHKLK